jgi:hypothetical protein
MEVYEESGSTGVLFAGDTGTEPREVRDVVCNLLGGMVDGKREPKVWASLVAYEARIRSQFHNLYLNLMVDRDEKVAFLRQVRDESDTKVPILLRSRKPTQATTLLFLFLRAQMLAAECRGERAVVTQEDILDHLQLEYRNPISTDEAGVKKAFLTAIKTATHEKILAELSGTPIRYEINPVLKMIFRAEQVEEIAIAFEAMKKGAEALVIVDTTGDDDTEEE